jgi:hypothetical protein
VLKVADGDHEAAIAAVGALRLQCTEAESRRAQLEPLAEDGRAFRTLLTDQMLAEGVRALGAEFAVEEYQLVAQAASIKTLTRMRDDLRSIGDKQLAGGRATTEAVPEKAAESEPSAPVGITMPPRVFKA